MKLEALPVPDIIAIVVLGGGCEPPILEKRRPYRELGMMPFERASMSSYRSSIVGLTVPLSLRVSEILPLLCSSTPLFPLSTGNFWHLRGGGVGTAP